MSFRLFLYYCALSGAWAAALGALAGQLLIPANGHPLLRAGLQGLLLGLPVAFGLGVVEALGTTSTRQPVGALLRGLVAAGPGALAGLLGALAGELLVGSHRSLVVVGWALAGLLVGASAATYDIVKQAGVGSLAAAGRKMMKGMLGGVLGGAVGYLLYLGLGLALAACFGDRGNLVSGTLWGFAAMGGCIGLFIGLAQVILKEAWLKVEAGFRPGRELILGKPEVVIGRGEGCDVGLFGDAAVEKVHARLLQRNGHYLLADAGTPSGTFLNNERIGQPTLLRAGDRIRIGQSVLLFGERRKDV